MTFLNYVRSLFFSNEYKALLKLKCDDVLEFSGFSGLKAELVGHNENRTAFVVNYLNERHGLTRKQFTNLFGLQE